MKELGDRVAVITGAASGIGYGMAEVFATEGMRLVLADVDEAKLDGAAAKLGEAGAEVLAVATDVARPERVEELASRALARFGAVHVLCNNAGVGMNPRTIWESSLADWNWLLGVNVMGVVHGLRSFMPILLRQAEAHVVNTASIVGLVTSSEGGGAYAASKHAVVALTEALQVQLDRSGASHVGVSCLCPGPVSSQIVANSAAQRPAGDARAPSPFEQVVSRAFERWLAGEGMAPRRVGELVRDAILGSQFYVLPHDQNADIERRMRTILTRGKPSLSPIPPGLRACLERELEDLQGGGGS